MFNYEQSAMSSREAVVALHSLATDNSPASTPDAIRTHVRMLAVDYQALIWLCLRRCVSLCVRCSCECLVLPTITLQLVSLVWGWKVTSQHCSCS